MPWPSFQMRRFWRAPPKQHTPFEVAVLAALLNLEMKVNKIMSQDDDLAAAMTTMGGDLTNISNGVAQVLKDLVAAQNNNPSPDPAVAKAISDLAGLHTQAVGIVTSMPADAQPTVPPVETPPVTAPE